MLYKSYTGNFQVHNKATTMYNVNCYANRFTSKTKDKISKMLILTPN